MRTETIGDTPDYILGGQSEMFGAVRAIGFGSKQFSVREIHRDHANAIIKRNHYSRKFVNNSYVHLGVFIGDDMLGVLQFGYAMNPASGGSVVTGTANDEYLELNRMWLDDFAPHCSESRAISHAIKFIRRAYPKVRWVQSFADERCGLNGKVYQAANFGFYGHHVSTFWEIDGEYYHNIVATTEDSRADTVAGRAWAAGKDRAVRHDLRQFRYLFFMAPRFAKRCVLKRQPFPAAGPYDAPESIGREASETLAGRSNHSKQELAA
jgi:hypothetical protein